MRIKSAQFAGVVMLFPLLSLPGSEYATFSIVAVDSATGAVGGSGASCNVATLKTSHNFGTEMK